MSIGTTTEHRAHLREHLEAIASAAGAAGNRGLTKAATEDVKRHANAARAALKSLEIAAGWRGIGAALAVDDEPARLAGFDAAMNGLLDQLGDGVESWAVKAELGDDTYEVAVYDGPRPGLYRAAAGEAAELLEAFETDQETPPPA